MKKLYNSTKLRKSEETPGYISIINITQMKKHNKEWRTLTYKLGGWSLSLRNESLKYYLVWTAIEQFMDQLQVIF